jgi:hypothetical protein
MPIAARGINYQFFIPLEANLIDQSICLSTDEIFELMRFGLIDFE